MRPENAALVFLGDIVFVSSGARRGEIGFLVMGTTRIHSKFGSGITSCTRTQNVPGDLNNYRARRGLSFLASAARSVRGLSITLSITGPLNAYECALPHSRQRTLDLLLQWAASHRLSRGASKSKYPSVTGHCRRTDIFGKTVSMEAPCCENAGVTRFATKGSHGAKISMRKAADMYVCYYLKELMARSRFRSGPTEIFDHPPVSA
jgi:hypothetical protein